MKLVSALAIAAVMTFATNTPAIAQDGIPGPEEDSYIWLEEARSDRALDWVRAENERTTELLAGDPRFDTVKAEALAKFHNRYRLAAKVYRFIICSWCNKNGVAIYGTING